MLQIRKEQTAVFENASRIDFVNRMVVHIRKFFPDHYAALKEENTRQLIEYGIDRAATHGIVNECDVCKFTDLMIGFGPGFDEDPKCAWAAQILGDATITNPSEKVDKLYDHGLSRLKARAARES